MPAEAANRRRILTRRTLALVLAGGRGSRLRDLTNVRAKPAVHFGGKFRIIDFALSNCMNSGLRRIGVITQYKSHSLLRHLQRGWSFLRNEMGEFVDLLPAQQRIDECSPATMCTRWTTRSCSRTTPRAGAVSPWAASRCRARRPRPSA